MCVQTDIIGDVDHVRSDCYHWWYGLCVFRLLSFVMWTMYVQTVIINDADHMRSDCYHLR